MQFLDVSFIVALVTATWYLATLSSNQKENKNQIKQLGKVMLQIAKKLEIEVVGIDVTDFK